MKKVIDNFSKQSDTYKKYRPIYPDELYQTILPWVKEKKDCWDCGTGNGQVAIKLSEYFKTVHATDVSENQISIAEKRPNIIYQTGRAEKTTFEADKFDLITVGQAIHWFDIKLFSQEVRRVSRDNGIIAVWGYDLLKIEEEVDRIINKFYYKITGPFWDKERKHVDNRYESIEFEFKELASPENLFIKANWKFEELIGYLNSWSAVQNYMQKNKGLNPVSLVYNELKNKWKDDLIKEVKFPVFMKIRLIEK